MQEEIEKEYKTKQRKPEKPTDKLSNPKDKASPKIGEKGDIELKKYLLTNKFITKGYRVNFNRKRDIIKSLFILHNDTFSIWTHLLGALFFIYLAYWIIHHFNDLRHFFDDLTLNFKNFDFANSVKEVIEHEIAPLLHILK